MRAARWNRQPDGQQRESGEPAHLAGVDFVTQEKMPEAPAATMTACKSASSGGCFAISAITKEVAVPPTADRSLPASGVLNPGHRMLPNFRAATTRTRIEREPTSQKSRLTIAVQTSRRVSPV